MSRHPLVYERIDDKLRQLARQSSNEPSWRKGLERLSASASDDARLAVYQAVRNGGGLPDEAGFYLVAFMIDELTNESRSEKLRKIERQIQRIERKHGLRKDEYWTDDDAPAEYQAARKRQREIWDEVFRENLIAHGENEIAELFARDRSAYEAKFEAGRLYFFGTAFSTPDGLEAWVDGLMEAIAGCISVDSPIGPLACRYMAEDDMVDVLVYATPVEIVGGADDGEIVDPDFDLDLIRFRELFSSIEDFGWSALGLQDEGGPHIWVEGVFRGQPVYVQLLSRAPEDEEPGMKFDAIRKRRR
ncbi:MAG TPA: hypothetical protein VHB99_15620 [Pirellulales bacterium]|nr:hypothetical protein [Pirellulales bacterium]